MGVFVSFSREKKKRQTKSFALVDKFNFLILQFFSNFSRVRKHGQS